VRTRDRGLTTVLLIVLAALPTGAAFAADVPPPNLRCTAAVLIDPGTRQIMFSHNGDQPRPPASLTKMMTGLLVAEAGNLDRTVVVSERAAAVGETSMNLTAGERIKLRHLLLGAMLSSANDAATACAEAVAGSVEEFVALMNRRAEELGLENTHFENPHGLHSDGHISTAEDLSRIALQVMGRAELRPIVRMQEAIVPWPGRPYDRKLINRNRLLELWDACDGIKTGYTRQAGRCLAASAYVDNWRLICVVLDSEDAWSDARTLLEWGFDNFYKVGLVLRDKTKATIEVRGGVRRTVPARAALDVIVVMPRNERPAEPELLVSSCRAPISAGEVCGQLLVTLPGGEKQTVDLVALEDVAESPWARIIRGQWTQLALLVVILLATGVLAHGAVAEALGARRAR